MRWVLRILLTCVLLLGLYEAQQQWRYQHAVARNQLQRATEVWPANADGWRALADQLQFTDFAASAHAAERAVQASPDDWNNWSVLAQAQMEMGEMSAARRSMQAMARHATGFAAHWRYANLLLLAGDMAGFWPQASAALSLVPESEISPTLQQMWRFSQDDRTQFDAAIAAAVRHAPDVEQPARLEIAAMQFYLEQKQLDAVAPWWQMALQDRHADPAQLGSVGDEYLVMLADAGRIAAAEQVWHDGEQMGLFAAVDGPSPANLIAGADEGALGWHLCTTCGPWVADDSGTLTFTFHGNQADSVVLARQRLLLAPAQTYQLSFQQSVEAGGLNPSLSDASGVQVEITGRSGTLLHSGAGTFTTPAAAVPWNLIIAYQRPAGQVPFRGTATITHVRLTRQ